MDGTIACLEQSDLDGAELQATALETTVDQMQRVTAGLLAKETLPQIRESAARGLREVKEGAAAKALETFKSALRTWLQNYPYESWPVNTEPSKTLDQGPA